jgi:hypothetical protein
LNSPSFKTFWRTAKGKQQRLIGKMDDQDLEKLHTDLKSSAQARGGRGGLGKGTSSSGKRIKIEFEEKVLTDVRPVETKADPKHIFVKFVKASDASESLKKVSVPESKVTQETQDNGHQLPKAALLKLTLSDLNAGDDVVDMLSTSLLKGGSSVVVCGVGLLRKATVVLENRSKVKFKNCYLKSVEGTAEDHTVEVFGVPKKSNTKQTLWQGTLRRGVVGEMGVRVLISD